MCTLLYRKQCQTSMPTSERIFYCVIQNYHGHKIDMISLFVSNAYLFMFQKSQSYQNITTEPRSFVFIYNFNFNSLYILFVFLEGCSCMSSFIFITDPWMLFYKIFFSPKNGLGNITYQLDIAYNHLTKLSHCFFLLAMCMSVKDSLYY